MAKIEILISQSDGTVLQAFDLSNDGDFPSFHDEAGEIALADEVKNRLNNTYRIEDK